MSGVVSGNLSGGGPSSNIQWLVTDQLGTPRMVFDKTGSLANMKRHDYLPFGEELSANQGLRTTTLGYSAVTLGLLERTPTRLRFRLKVSNVGDHAVFIVTDPVRLDGSKGAYLSLSYNDQSLLELGLEVFPPPLYTRLAPKTRVTFKRLEPGVNYEDEVLVTAPCEETRPPWGATPTPKSIDLTKIERATVSIGVLPDDPGVEAAFACERSPTGMEIVKSGTLKGKALFEIQVVVSSEKLQL